MTGDTGWGVPTVLHVGAFLPTLLRELLYMQHAPVAHSGSLFLIFIFILKPKGGEADIPLHKESWLVGVVDYLRLEEMRLLKSNQDFLFL